MTLDINWNETLTITMPPALDSSTVNNVRRELETELLRDAYTAQFDASTRPQVKNVARQTLYGSSKGHVRAQQAEYASWGIVSLTGHAWLVNKATDTQYWHEGTCYPERRSSRTECCAVAGTFPKRIKAIARKFYDITLRTEFVARLGELARRGIQAEETTYYIKLTNRIDWRAGKFGDEGSCYWGERRGAKDMITGAGGGAVTLYHDPEYTSGAGRCWIIPVREGAAIFNAYGTARLEHIASVLAAHYNMVYNAADLMNDGSDDDILYINGGHGYYLHPEGTENLTEIDFYLKEPGRVSCAHCDCRLDREDAREYDGDYFCNDCFSEHYIICDHCGETADRDDAINIGYRSYCSTRCAERSGYSQCDECGDWSRDSSLTETADGRSLCDDCLRQDYSECDECGGWHPDSDVSTTDDNHSLCTNCYDTHTFTCADCAHTLHIREEEDWDGESLCPACFNLRAKEEAETIAQGA